MENYKKRAIELITGLAIEEKKNPAVVGYTPSKTAVSQNESKYFIRQIGGSGRKYLSALSSMIAELTAERRANIHSIMVIKDGCVIMEASHPGYSTNTFHLAHSMSKTLTAIAVGFLYDEGKLDLSRRVADIFPELSYSDKRFKNLTVSHLLAMQSGVAFAEAGVVTEDKWLEAFFSSSMSFSPGESFAYNSMNSYVLACIVTRITGKSLKDYMTPKLLQPLGIDNFLWEIGPEGVEKGGFGAYMSAESFAKIGWMLLGGGMFASERILSEEYISLMTSTHSVAPLEAGAFNYGYHIWVSREGKDFLLNGMLGQNVWVNPEESLVVSINAGNNELFQDSPALGIIRKHLLAPKTDITPTRAQLRDLKRECATFYESRHWIRPLKKKSGLLYFLGLRESRPYDTAWDSVIGSYALPENNTSVLPTFVTVMQNNYQGGISNISLERNGNGILLTVKEGAATHVYPVGLYDFAESVQNYSGELYIARAIGEAIEDEDRNPVYKIEIIFPELPNTRIIKITRTTEGIRLRMTETPDEKIAESFMASMKSSVGVSLAMSFIEKKAGEDFISKYLHALFHPDFLCVNTSIAGWQDIIAAYNRERDEKREGASKLIRTLISRLTREQKPESTESEDGSAGGFLSRAFKNLISKTGIPELIKGIGLFGRSQEDSTDTTDIIDE